MRENFGEYSYGKKLPTHLLIRATKEEREALFDGYMDGDGCVTQHPWHFGGVSEQLVDDMQILAGMLGYGSRKVSYDCMAGGRTLSILGREYTSKQFWRVHVHRSRPTAHIQNDAFESSFVENLSVHCVTTSTGYFMARTNGKPFVAGNCDATRYAIVERHRAMQKPIITGGGSGSKHYF